MPSILHEISECLPAPRGHSLCAVQHDGLLGHGNGFCLKGRVRRIAGQLLSLSQLLLGFLGLDRYTYRKVRGRGGLAFGAHRRRPKMWVWSRHSALKAGLVQVEAARPALPQSWVGP